MLKTVWRLLIHVLIHGPILAPTIYLFSLGYYFGAICFLLAYSLSLFNSWLSSRKQHYAWVSDASRKMGQASYDSRPSPTINRGASKPAPFFKEELVELEREAMRQRWQQEQQRQKYYPCLPDCVDCGYYHGFGIVCAVHPTGYAGKFCSDKEIKG